MVCCGQTSRSFLESKARAGAIVLSLYDGIQSTQFANPEENAGMWPAVDYRCDIKPVSFSGMAVAAVPARCRCPFSLFLRMSWHFSQKEFSTL